MPAACLPGQNSLSYAYSCKEPFADDAKILIETSTGKQIGVSYSAVIQQKI